MTAQHRSPEETWAGRLALPVLAAGLLVGLIRLLADMGAPFVNSGDHALLELDVMRAMGADQLLGVYSRFGWRHPGPAFSYLLAPFWWLSGGSSRGLILGIFALNAAAAAGIVAVVRRYAGGSVAIWTSALVAVLLAGFGSRLWMPWTPLVLALPMALCYVLTAACSKGSKVAFLGVAVLGSFAVQAHIGTLPVVGFVVLLAGLLFWSRGRWSPEVPHSSSPAPPSWRRRGPALALLAILVAMWVPPLVEQATTDPGNLTRLHRFLVQGEPPSPEQTGHPLGAALAATANQTAVIPLGAHRRPATDRVPGRLALAGIAGLAAGIVAVVGWRRREGFALGLGAVSLGATAVGVLALTRVTGALEGHLVYWKASLPLPAWIGLGLLVRQSLEPAWDRAGRMVVATVSLLAVAATTLLGLTVAREAYPYEHSQQAAELAHGLDRELSRRGGTEILVGFPPLPWLEWPPAAGVVLELAKRGYEIGVDEGWLFMFGPSYEPPANPDLHVVISSSEDPPGEPLVRSGNLVASVVEDADTVR